jgi:hypothetical protein
MFKLKNLMNKNNGRISTAGRPLVILIIPKLFQKNTSSQCKGVLDSQQ